MSEDLIFEVKYTIAYSDGRPEKHGRFPFPVNDPRDTRAFKKIAELEPSLIDGKSLFIRTQPIIPPRGAESNPGFEIYGNDIRSLLNQIKTKQGK